jgi:hypothetical protein
MPGAALQQALLWPIGLLFLVGLVSCYVCRARYPNGMSPANSLLLSIGAIIVSGAAVVLPVYLFCFRFWGSATSVPFWAFSALVLCALLAVPLGFAAVRYEAKIRKLALTDVLIVPRPPWQVPAGSLLVAVVLGACLFVIPRKIASDQVLTNWRSFADQYDHQRLAERVAGRVALGPDALAQARQVFAEEWQGRGQGMAGNRRFNEFTGLPVREEDSPGNYVIEASGGNIQYYYIDANGRKTLVWDSGKKRTEN